jgi:sugar/nucleoside kinase (ribokinase family)
MRRAAPDIEIRYSDSGDHNPVLQADLARRGIVCRFRGLFRTMDNLVTADPDTEDKLVFKSEPPPLSVQPAPGDQVSWLAAGGTILLNSDKHRAWVTKLAGAAARGQLNLHVVLTTALPAEYLMEAVVPNARLLVAGLDELGESLKIAVRDSIDGAVTALRFLAHRAMSPMVHVTMGVRGVLLADPENMTVLHVRLSKGRAEGVRKAVGRDHSRVCGCGDAYAGAVTAFMLAGRSVWGAGSLHGSPFAAAAIAGCAAAVRHLGYLGPLAPEDFVVSEVAALDEADAGAA